MILPNVWNEPLKDYIQQQLQTEAARRFRIHQPPEDHDQWLRMRDKLRQQIVALLGSSPEPRLPLDIRETGSIGMDGYVVKKIYYQSRPDFYVTGNLYVPDGSGPFPGVLGMHGHWKQGRLAERVQARGHSLAKNGYVALLVDAFGSGERSTVHGEFEYHGGTLGGSLLNIGETLMGMQVVDNMRGVDVLCSLECVDSDNIGATGASGGGNQTMWLAALDQRIKAAVPVVSVGTFESYIAGINCVCEVLPDGLNLTEESSVLGLIAPRALKICNCLGDSNPTFFPSEMLRSCKGARTIYQGYDGDDKLSYQIFDLSHGYWPEIREAMLGWFDLHLKGIGTGAPRREKPFNSLPEPEMMVFEKGNRPETVPSIVEFCRVQGARLKEQFIATSRYDAAGKKSELANLLKTTEPIQLKKVHAYAASGEWQRFALESVDGRMTPVLFKPPADNTKSCIIAAAPEGKHQLAELDSINSMLADGSGIILADLWGTGETAYTPVQPLPPGRLHHELSRASLWLGRTMMGEWVKDYQLLIDFARGHLPGHNISLFGYKECGMAALFAATLTTGKISEVVLEQSPVSWVLKTPHDPLFLSMPAYLPRLLHWGDFSLAAALTNVSVKLRNPVHMNGVPVSLDDQDALVAEFNAVKAKCNSNSKVSFAGKFIRFAGTE